SSPDRTAAAFARQQPPRTPPGRLFEEYPCSWHSVRRKGSLFVVLPILLFDLHAGCPQFVRERAVGPVHDALPTELLRSLDVGGQVVDEHAPTRFGVGVSLDVDAERRFGLPGASLERRSEVVEVSERIGELLRVGGKMRRRRVARKHYAVFRLQPRDEG